MTTETEDGRQYHEEMYGMPASAVIRDLAMASNDFEELDPGAIYSWMSPNGHVQLVDLTLDQYLENPKRKKGNLYVADVASLAALYAKFKVNGESTLYADLPSRTVTAVLDDDSPTDGTGAHWRSHRVTYQLTLTPAWTAWMTLDRQMTDQVAFSEHLEDRISNIAPGEVSAARLLEISQEFVAHTQVAFTAGSRLRDGQTQLQYVETIDAAGGGKAGTVSIPQGFDLAIRPFSDSDAFSVHARLRYRIANRALRLGYFIDDPAGIVEDALKSVVAKVADATGEQVILGKAPVERS